MIFFRYCERVHFILLAVIEKDDCLKIKLHAWVGTKIRDMRNFRTFLTRNLRKKVVNTQSWKDSKLTWYDFNADFCWLSSFFNWPWLGHLMQERTTKVWNLLCFSGYCCHFFFFLQKKDLSWDYWVSCESNFLYFKLLSTEY